MIRIIKQVLIVLLSFSGFLADILMLRVNGYDHTKFISLNDQQCITQTTLLNLHSNEFIQGFSYYPFVVNVNRCMGNYNTLNDLSNRVRVPSKTGDLNLTVLI